MWIKIALTMEISFIFDFACMVCEIIKIKKHKFWRPPREVMIKFKLSKKYLFFFINEDGQKKNLT